MGRGLNRAQREIIRGMVAAGYSEQQVLDQINILAGWDGWDFNQNVCFCGELAARGYVESAKSLEYKMRQ